MSAEGIAHAWAGWWSVPQFDHPLRPLAASCDDPLWKPMSIIVSVHQEPVLAQDDPTHSILNVKRRLPTRCRHILVQWSHGGTRYVARGQLSDSLLLAEGASVFRRVAVDDAHPIVPAELCDGGSNVVGPARDAQKEKPLYVVPSSSATVVQAEQFVCPMTLQLMNVGASDMHIRISLDWKRLHHGVGTSIRVATPQTTPPSLLCVRVLRATGAAFEFPPQAESFPFAPTTDVLMTRVVPQHSLLTFAARICALVQQRAPEVFRFVPSVNTRDDAAAFQTENEFDASTITTAGGANILTRVASSSMSKEEFRSLILQEQLTVHYAFDASVAGVSSGKRSVVELGVLSTAIEACIRQNHLPGGVAWILPVDDSILAQLQAHHFRCSLMDVQLGVSPGSHSSKTDIAPQWRSEPLDPCAPFVRCEGTYSSINMAAMSISKVLFSTP